MSTTSTSVIRTPSVATDQNIPRYVEDQLRRKFPESAKLMAMIAGGSVKGGKMTTSKGLIAKKQVSNSRFECYTYTPLAVTFTASADLNSTTQALASTSGLTGYMTLINTANGTVARIDSVNSATELTVTSIGSTAFAVTSGDILMVMAPAYEQGSSDPKIISKNEDLVYNNLQIERFPVSISRTAKDTPSYFGDYLSLVKETNLIEGKRKVENSLLFSQRPSSGNTTAGGSTLSTAFSSTRGLYQWAANEFDMNGSATLDKLLSDMPLAYTERTVGMDSPMKMLLGNSKFGSIQKLVREKQSIFQAGGELEQVGLRTYKLLTDMFEVELVTHDSFNQGAFANQALLFNSDEIFYAFLKGADLKPRLNIQSPSMDGQTDEFFGEIGIGVLDGGASIMKIVNWTN